MKRLCARSLAEFFYKNISVKQTVLKNTFWLTLSQGLTGIVMFFLTVVVIRKFGDARYGMFAFAFSFASLFSTLFDFGFSTAITREFARDPKQEKVFSALLTLKVLLGVVVVVLVFTASRFITSDQLTRKVMLVLGFYIFTLELLFFFYALFRARQKMQFEAALRIMHLVFLSLFVLGVLYFSPSVLNLSYAYVSANIVTLIVVLASIILWDRKVLLFHPMFNLSAWKTFLLIGWYLALAKGMGDITMNTDSVMLGYFGLITENGWYKAAAKINGLVLFPMALISTAVFPALAAMLKESKERFIRLWKLWYKVTIFLAGMLCSIAFANADEIVETLYPSEFQPAAAALRILIVMALIVYSYNLYHHVLIIFNLQKKIFHTVFVAAIVNVSLNFVLIPKFGFYGAAVATVITHLAILLQYWRLTLKKTFIKPVNSEFLSYFGIAVFCGICVYSVSLLGRYCGLDLFLVIFCEVLIYCALFVVLQKMARLLSSRNKQIV